MCYVVVIASRGKALCIFPSFGEFAVTRLLLSQRGEFQRHSTLALHSSFYSTQGERLLATSTESIHHNLLLLNTRVHLHDCATTSIKSLSTFSGMSLHSKGCSYFPEMARHWAAGADRPQMEKNFQLPSNPIKTTLIYSPIEFGSCRSGPAPYEPYPPPSP